jgi:hypothetical protein
VTRTTQNLAIKADSDGAAFACGVVRTTGTQACRAPYSETAARVAYVERVIGISAPPMHIIAYTGEKIQYSGTTAVV